jgi:ATP-binding cassette subfamily B protein
MPQHDAQARDGLAGSTSPGAGSLKARFVALRTLRPFVVMVWRISPSLTFWSLLLRLARALLPIAILYVGKLIIDDVVRLAQLPARPPW